MQTVPWAGEEEFAVSRWAAMCSEKEKKGVEPAILTVSLPNAEVIRVQQYSLPSASVLSVYPRDW